MWPIGTPFHGTVRKTPRYVPARRRVRDLAGLAPVLGRFGPFEIRLAETKAEIRKAQRLRYAVFYEEGNAVPSRKAALVRRDICPYDKVCDHLLVLDIEARNRFGRRKPKVVGTYRLLRTEVAERTQGFYSAREFDLAPLLERQASTRFLELGRSCVHPQYRSKRAIELLWRGLWVYATHHRIDAMIGCASLPGTNPAALALPLSFLHHQATADDGWSVRPLPGRAVAMGTLSPDAIDSRKAIAALPPLLKAYLRVGARFGDGAVVDAQFGTTDVFAILRLADMEQRYIEYYGSPMEMPESYVA
jgi:putative hemolysin